MRQLAESARAPLPLADLAFNHLLSAHAAGHAQKDWGAIALAVRAAAGLPVENLPVDKLHVEEGGGAGGKEGGNGGDRAKASGL